MDGDGEGLEECGCIEGDLFREPSERISWKSSLASRRQRCSLVTPERRVVDLLLKRSLEVRNTLCTTSEPHLFAKVIASFSAYSALAAWNADFQRYSIANGESIDVRPNGYNYPGRFMAKRQWSASAEIAISEFLVVAYI